MMQKIRFYSIVTLVVGGALLIGAGSYIIFGSYSEGSRAGRLIKLTKKGYVFKTYEGELDMGGISTIRERRNEEGGITSIWDFSVDKDDQRLIEQLERLGGRNVRLRYEERFFRLFWEGETRYFVTGVEAAD
jgi:hypothetical protein